MTSGIYTLGSVTREVNTLSGQWLTSVLRKSQPHSGQSRVLGSSHISSRIRWAKQPKENQSKPSLPRLTYRWIPMATNIRLNRRV